MVVVHVYYVSNTLISSLCMRNLGLEKSCGVRDALTNVLYFSYRFSSICKGKPLYKPINLALLCSLSLPSL